MYALAKPLLFKLDAERAHNLALRSIESAYRLGLNPLLGPKVHDLPCTVLGLAFRNPVGLAAGMDKNAAHIDALASLGFGFIEVGTITPKPQAGNPTPRMFRLSEDRAVINRLGFNNGGLSALAKNLESVRFSGVLGINIGKNKDTPNANALDDYVQCLRAVYARASYITINISSPNTQGLRDLQQLDALMRLLGGLTETAEQLAGLHGVKKPMLVKVAPDLNEQELDDIAEVVRKTGMPGVIASNTTIQRPPLRSPLASETGGLSGAPLLPYANKVLQGLRARLPKNLVLIGVGGISEGADARSKIDAGAALVQFYSGLIYRGPTLIRECVEALRAHPQFAGKS
jgi:dihydroorotate dehydrogenase